MNGKPLMNEKMEESVFELHLNSFSAGQYILMLRNNDRYGVKTIVKNKLTASRSYYFMVILYHDIIHALLTPFSHVYDKGFANPCSLLGLGKYLASPWEELGYTEPATWVHIG